MIFVSVGTQLPFERLIRAMDDWAGSNGTEEVIAQIGETQYQPENMKVVGRLDPASYASYFNRANVVVSHVGMGTIISGLESSKQLVLVPRLAALGEHRNDHQLGTASKFSHFANIRIVNDVAELPSAVSDALGSNFESCPQNLKASPDLLDALRGFVEKVKTTA